MNDTEKHESEEMERKAKPRASSSQAAPQKWAKPGTSVHTEEKAAPVQFSKKKTREAEKPKSHVLRHTIQDAAYERVQEDEEENTGLQALHESEQITETVWQHGGHAVESWKHHQTKMAVKEEGTSNPISHSN